MLARASFSKFPILSQPSTAAFMEMIMKTAEKSSKFEDNAIDNEDDKSVT